MKHGNWPSVMLFLLGLTSDTQIRIIAYMDISELMAYVLGPCFFVMDLNDLRKDGFGTFLLMWLICTVSCAISASANDTYFAYWLRGIAVPISMFCLTCTIYHFLKRDFYAFKWFFLGAAISGILSTFMFQRGSSIETREGTLTGEAAVEHVMNYSLYWLSRLGTWLVLPLYMFYLKVPKLYSVAVGLFLMGFGFFSAGNRSGLIVTAMSVLLIVVAGKTPAKMRFFKKHFVVMALAMAMCVPMFMVVYKYCAVHNYLGEKAYQKYVQQTKQGGGALGLLRAGRSEFFIGLDACLDKPIIGHGPRAVDTIGYVRDYLNKYADPEDARRLIQYMDENGIVGEIPTHSWIISFWVWYGVGGLVCILYVGWIMCTTLKNRLAVVPELYGYWAFCLLPSVWHYFFSPFGGRTGVTMMLVLCLMTRAIEQRQKGNRFVGIVQKIW